MGQRIVVYFEEIVCLYSYLMWDRSNIRSISVIISGLGDRPSSILDFRAFDKSRESDFMLSRNLDVWLDLWPTPSEEKEVWLKI